MQNTYDYITDEWIASNSIDHLLDIMQTYANAFILTKDQYAHWIAYQQEHKICQIDPSTGFSRYGAIGGGMEVAFEVSDGIVKPYACCHTCKDKTYLMTVDADVKHYEQYAKYANKFCNTELVRFAQLLYDLKPTQFTVKFVGTGLGNLIDVEIDGKNYSITDIESW